LLLCPPLAVHPRLSSVALTILGFWWKDKIALRMTFAASADGTMEPSASFRRRMARA